MVATVNRNATLRAVERRPETPDVKTKPLFQIIKELETRTREALELARELEEFFRSAGVADMDITWDTEETTDSQPRIFRIPNLQGTGGEYG